MGKSRDEFVSNEKAQRTVWITATLLLVIGLAIAYLVWPSGITDFALAEIRFGGLLRAVASGVIAFAAVVMTAMLWN
jgi:hypothetical protein